MGTKQPQPQPQPPRIRVAIMGDHPWAESFGWIEPKDGGYESIRVLGEPPTLYKIKLDSGHECYAGLKHIHRVDRPVSPPPPKVKP